MSSGIREQEFLPMGNFQMEISFWYDFRWTWTWNQIISFAQIRQHHESTQGRSTLPTCLNASMSYQSFFRSRNAQRHPLPIQNPKSKDVLPVYFRKKHLSFIHWIMIRMDILSWVSRLYEPSWRDGLTLTVCLVNPSPLPSPPFCNYRNGSKCCKM